MIIINNPHNPTGAVLCEEDIDQLEKILLELIENEPDDIWDYLDN